MHISKAIKRIESRLNVKLKWNSYTYEGQTDRYHFEVRPNSDDSVNSFYVRGINQENHPEYDEFVGHNPANLKKLLDYIDPQSKFAIGTLIQVKDRKRTRAHNYNSDNQYCRDFSIANKIGIIVKLKGFSYDIVTTEGIIITNIYELDLIEINNK